MLTLNLSFKSLPFLSTQFESCKLPISPLISFSSLSPYKFCFNSILCYVFYLLSPLPCHPSILPSYLSLCSLLKSLLSSTSVWEWQFTYLALGRTLYFSICRSCPKLHPLWYLYSWFLCTFTSSPTSLSVIIFKPSWYLSPCPHVYFKPTL